MIKVAGLLLEPSTFPNGELNLQKLEEDISRHLGELDRPGKETLTFKYTSDADLMLLYMLSQTKVIRCNVDTLDIAYMPYSRMDRGGYDSSACSLRYVATLIKSMEFKNIKVCDPHSDLTLAYLGTNAASYYPFEAKAIDSDTVIMFPDAGAQKRYAGMKCFANSEQIVGNKVRDFKTSKIVSYEVSNGKIVADRTVVIVDDLCSYGGTFKLAGDELKKFNPWRIDLMVSHCEESINKGKLFDADSPIDVIWTTNSIIDHSTSPNLNIERIF